MTRYLIDDLEKWPTFSKRLEKRVIHISSAAKVDTRILTGGVHNAYTYWLRLYDKSAADGQHRRLGINILQMKIDILFRALLNRPTLEIVSKHPTHRATTNVVKLFNPDNSSGFVDYAGVIAFQNAFVEAPCEYLALDFCGSIYREAAAFMGESPFGEGDAGFQIAVQLSSGNPQIMSNQDLCKLLRLRPLPLVSQAKTPDREQKELLE